LPDAADIEKRDLSLNNPLNKDKYYNEVRNSIPLFKNSKMTIEDITAVEMVTIDSLDKVKKVQEEICKTMGHHQHMNDVKNLDFLLLWPSLDQEEKNKKYSKFCCHEVNLFLYFKDPEYFSKVVKPFLSNKMSKDFIDNWLLGNDSECETYKELHKFTQMNALEKCLLLTILMKTDQLSAKRIAE
jgi:hypothetical protein